MKLIYLVYIFVLFISTSSFARIISYGEYNIHFVTRDGISNKLWPGFSNLQEGTYISLLVNEKTRDLYLGFQVEDKGPQTMKDGTGFPESWKFPRRRGHAMIRNAAGIPADAFMYGGGLLIKDGQLQFRTRTRGINGTSIERTPTIEFQVDAATSNRVQGRTTGDVNGFLNFKHAEKIASVLANNLGVEILLHYLEWGKVATEAEKKKLDEMKQKTQKRIEREGLPPAKRWFHSFMPAGGVQITHRCKVQGLGNALGGK